MNDKVRQFNIRLPESMLWKLKAKCALSGFTLVDIGLALIRAYMDGKIKIKRTPDGRIKIS